jgi:transposase
MRKQQFRRGGNRLVTCRVCGKQTHSDLDGCIGLALCRPCREAAELENEHFDGHHEGNPHAGCSHCQAAKA